MTPSRPEGAAPTPGSLLASLKRMLSPNPGSDDREAAHDAIAEAEAAGDSIDATAELLSAWRDYFELWNVRHEIEGCPEDDTCECPLVGRINAAIRKAEGRA